MASTSRTWTKRQHLIQEYGNEQGESLVIAFKGGEVEAIQVLQRGKRKPAGSEKWVQLKNAKGKSILSSGMSATVMLSIIGKPDKILNRGKPFESYCFVRYGLVIDFESGNLTSIHLNTQEVMKRLVREY